MQSLSDSDLFVLEFVNYSSKGFTNTWIKWENKWWCVWINVCAIRM